MQQKLKYYKVNNSSSYTTNLPFLWGPHKELHISHVETNKNCIQLSRIYNLPIEWIDLFKNIPDVYEIKKNYVILFSIKQIIEIMLDNLVYNILDYIDIGMIPLSMGHCKIISWDRISMKPFVRLDGGSNPFERSYNYEYYVKNYGKNDGFHVSKSIHLNYFNDIFELSEDI